jgi:tetrahydromethanopterin S-methyltransferase subunit A
METEDLGAIKAKINELKARDPGAFKADPMVVEVKEAAGAGAEEGTGEVVPLSGELALIHARMKIIERMVTGIGIQDRFSAGVYGGKMEGLMIGLIVAFVMLGVIFWGVL